MVYNNGAVIPGRRPSFPRRKDSRPKKVEVKNNALPVSVADIREEVLPEAVTEVVTIDINSEEEITVKEETVVESIPGEEEEQFDEEEKEEMEEEVDEETTSLKDVLSYPERKNGKKNKKNKKSKKFIGAFEQEQE
jgi:hypothetical protein